MEKWRNVSVRWVPKWINNVSLKPFSLNFIIGPRQVGKTTGVKLLIDKLTKKVNPYCVFGSVLGWWRVIKGYIDLGMFKISH